MEIDVHQIFADYFQHPILKPLAYECSLKLAEGHICLDIEHYNQKTGQSITTEALLETPYCTDANGLSDEEIAQINTPFVIWGKLLYMQRYFLYETEILKALKRITSNYDTSQIWNLLRQETTLINKLFSASEEIDWQKVAVINSLIQPFSIISGGPGTGKTSSISRLLHIYFTLYPQKRVALIAPTGKAAVHIKESMLQYAKQQNKEEQSWLYSKFENQIENATIHRFLGHKKGSHYFKHNEQNVLSQDLIIVDEASMIGISLMSKLLNAVGAHSQMILLGDKNQLMSVEAGSVLGDMCSLNDASENTFSTEHCQRLNYFLQNEQVKECDTPAHLLTNTIVELKKSYRFKTNKGISQLSLLSLKNEINVDDLTPFVQQKYQDVHFLTHFSHQDILRFAHFFIPYIEEPDPQKALQCFNSVRLLSPFHNGMYGVNELNFLIKSYLIKKGLLEVKKGSLFFHNQVVIISKNNYNLDLFNGDIGLIRQNEQGEFRAYFEDEKGTLKVINPFMLSHFDTIFAMTIHKSQGSEFDKVALVIPEHQQQEILNKELIYTAITRAKKELYVFSSEEAFVTANNTATERLSGLKDRIFF